MNKNKFESTLSYSDGEVHIDSPENPILIDIEYIGTIKGVSKLPEGFCIIAKGQRIMVIRFTDSIMPSHIMSYIGTFHAKKVKVYAKNKVSYSTINREKVIWQTMNDSTYQNVFTEWDNFGSEGHYFPSDSKKGLSQYLRLPAQKSHVINKNMTSDIGRFTKNNEKYEGKVIYDTRGIFTDQNRNLLKANVNVPAIKKAIRKGRK